MTNPSSTQPRGTNGHEPGQFAERVFTAPPAEATLSASGDLSVRAADVLAGDTVFYVDGDEATAVGRATFIWPSPHQASRVIIRWASGGAATVDADEMLAVHRDRVAPDYDPSANYDERIGAAYHMLTTAHILRQIIERETQDDFFLAVAGHANATASILNLAAKQDSFIVKTTIVNNPRTAASTLRRIRDDALTARRDAKEVFERQGAMRNTLWEIEHYGQLADAAGAALLARAGEPHT